MTSVTTTNLLEILNYVYSVETNIPEGIFLELCNRLKKTYDLSKVREDEVINICDDILTLNEFETEAQEEADEEEALEYCNILNQIKSSIHKLEHIIEYKVLKKCEYNKYNDDEIKDKIDTLNSLIIEKST